MYFSRTMQNHILQLLQQHGFVVEEFRCWIGLPAVQIFPLQRTFGASLNEKYVKDDHKLFSSWKPMSSNNSNIKTKRTHNLDAQSLNCFEKNLSLFKHLLCYLCSIVNKILAHEIWKSFSWNSFSFYSNLKNVPTFPEFVLYLLYD